MRLKTTILASFLTVTVPLLLLTLSACEKIEDNVPTEAANDSIDHLQESSDNSIQNLGTAEFAGLTGHRVSGEATLVLSTETQTYSLVMENFSSQNGPDLKVYLTNDESASSFLNLGDLKSTSGTLVYEFPASEYREELDKVMIWCEDFRVAFGIGTFI